MMTPAGLVLLPEEVEARAHLDALGEANRAFARLYPGERPVRQPVHTVYGGAHLFKAETTRRLGELALQAMGTYARDPTELARGLGFDASSDASGPAALDDTALGALHARVLAKLAREPVEDFRIDFEDGFGARPDAEEDAVAESAANEVARGLLRASCRRSSGSASNPSARSGKSVGRGPSGCSSTGCSPQRAAVSPRTSW